MILVTELYSFGTSQDAVIFLSLEGANLFLLECAQLFKIVPCPRHRLPRWASATHSGHLLGVLVLIVLGSYCFVICIWNNVVTLADAVNLGVISAWWWVFFVNCTAVCLECFDLDVILY